MRCYWVGLTRIIGIDDQRISPAKLSSLAIGGSSSSNRSIRVAAHGNARHKSRESAVHSSPRLTTNVSCAVLYGLRDRHGFPQRQLPHWVRGCLCWLAQQLPREHQPHAIIPVPFLDSPRNTHIASQHTHRRRHHHEHGAFASSGAVPAQAKVQLSPRVHSLAAARRRCGAHYPRTYWTQRGRAVHGVRLTRGGVVLLDWPTE